MWSTFAAKEFSDLKLHSLTGTWGRTRSLTLYLQYIPGEQFYLFPKSALKMIISSQYKWVPC